ncbi:hypothetical protein V8C43DRAFT_268379 [Trichoderma afarasin]
MFNVRRALRICELHSENAELSSPFKDLFSRMEGTCPFCDDDDISISFQYSFLYLVVKAPITIALNIARVLATLIYPLPSRRIPLLRIIAEHRAQPTRGYGAGRTHGCLPGHPWLLLLLAMCSVCGFFGKALGFSSRRHHPPTYAAKQLFALGRGCYQATRIMCVRVSVLARLETSDKRLICLRG